MKPLTFWRGAVVALALSVVGAVSLDALALLAGPGAALRWLVSGLALAYLLVVLASSSRRVGRVVAIAGWLLTTAGLAALNPPLLAWVVVQTGAVWLMRSLYHYRSLWSALADLALCGFAIAAAAATASHTHSVFLSLWSFFLVQGLFAFIPNSAMRRRKPDSADSFATAERAAAAALRRLAGIN